MALNARQTQLYVHTCELYAPLPVSSTRLPNNDIQSLRYSSIPTALSVKFYRETAPEFNKGIFLGRITKEDTVSLMDKAHFDIAETIGPNWLIKMIDPAYPDYGQYFLITGDPMTKSYRANKQIFFIKKLTKPNLV
jgi:hypothetical protein